MTQTAVSSGTSASFTLPAGNRVLILGQGTYRIGPRGTSARPTVDELIDNNTSIGPYEADCTVQIWSTGSTTYELVAPSDVLDQTGRPIAGDSLRSLVSGAVKSCATAALFGDSIKENQFSNYGSGTSNATTGRGPIHHFNALTGGRFRVTRNCGVTGSTTVGVAANSFDGVGGVNSWLARIDAAVAFRDDIFFVGYPHNDSVLGVEAADTIAALKVIHTKIRAAGLTIIQATSTADVRPVSGSSLPGNSADKIAAHRTQVMNWIKEAAKRGQFLLFEQYSPTSDPVTGALTANYTNDNLIHLADLGAGAIGAYNASGSLGDWVRATYPVYECTGYPNWAAQIGNPFLSGSGGTNGSGFTGTIPAGFATFKGGTPTSPTVSSVARTDNKRGSYVAITTTATADSDRVGFTFTRSLSATWSAGAKLKFSYIRGSYGDHWMCTTAGTSSGTEPAAMAAASTLGQTVTDAGGVVWTRVETLNAGDEFEVVLAYQIVGAVSTAVGARPIIFCNATGGTGGGSCLFYTGPDKLATCHAQTSATPDTLDKVIRSTKLTFSSGTTALAVTAAMQMENTFQGTFLISSFSIEKIVTP